MHRISMNHTVQSILTILTSSFRLIRHSCDNCNPLQNHDNMPAQVLFYKRMRKVRFNHVMKSDLEILRLR